ncbi:hypothetical protein BD779DRAFT_250165 [Infundibulicybe gibba]|nr:hypothetical protein BD779DRAFT_250165 [Infundibulicybe gibba]
MTQGISTSAATFSLLPSVRVVTTSTEHHSQLIDTESILYYDHSITIDREIKYLWMRPQEAKHILVSIQPLFLVLSGYRHSVVRIHTIQIPKSCCKSYELFKQVSIAANQFLVSVS